MSGKPSPAGRNLNRLGHQPQVRGSSFPIPRAPKGGTHRRPGAGGEIGMALPAGAGAGRLLGKRCTESTYPMRSSEAGEGTSLTGISSYPNLGA